MKKMTVRCTFTKELLGSQSANPWIHQEFIASKAPDADRMQDEIEALGVDEVVEKNMTIFHKDKQGNPCLWDYQIIGFFKGACQALQRCKGQEYSKQSCKIKNYKKVIDQSINVYPEMIRIKGVTGIEGCQRPLRAQTAQGERVALANSESVNRGSYIEFSVVCEADEHMAAVVEWLNKGRTLGMGQWRGSGKKGQFVWKDITPADEKELSDSGKLDYDTALKLSKALTVNAIWK